MKLSIDRTRVAPPVCFRIGHPVGVNDCAIVSRRTIVSERTRVAPTACRHLSCGIAASRDRIASRSTSSYRRRRPISPLTLITRTEMGRSAETVSETRGENEMNGWRREERERERGPRRLGFPPSPYPFPSKCGRRRAATPRAFPWETRCRGIPRLCINGPAPERRSSKLSL